MVAQLTLGGETIRKYYRTMLYLVFRTVEAPKDKTPDPLFGIRITVVSDVKGKYNIERFRPVIYHTGIIIAPQTHWKDLIERGVFETVEIAAEIDEEIDVDELGKSVPIYKRLNYAERVAVFFSSKREKKWRQTKPRWWRDKLLPDIIPEMTPEGLVNVPFDYVYNEERIKSDEELAFRRRRVRSRFDNQRGELI